MVRERIAAEKAAKIMAGKAKGAVTTSDGGEEVGMDGIALVEGLKLREREDEEEARREKEDEEMQ
jgi:coiled-coil domain-containing protein 12